MVSASLRAARPAVARLGSMGAGGRGVLVLGLVVDGIGSYVYLSASGRALGPDQFASVSVLWAVMFLIGNGLFIPVDQELARAIAAGVGGGAALRRISAVAAAAVGVVGVVILAGSGWIGSSLFRNRAAFAVVLLVGVAGLAVMFVVRGVLAGTGDYRSYGLLFIADALAKAVPVVILAGAGVDDPLPYAWVMALSGWVGCAAALVAARPLAVRVGGDPPDWRPLLTSLGFLLLTSLTSLTLMNLSTVAVEVLSGPAEEAAAGVFLSALVIARIPLFLFQAVQAVVLPRLSARAAEGDADGFTRDVRQLGLVIAGATAVAVAGSFVAGSLVVRVLFGDEFDRIGGWDMGMLTLASMLMTATLTLNQAQIALRRQHQSWWPWAAGLVVFVVALANSGAELLPRVEGAMVASAAATVVVVAWLLRNEIGDLRVQPAGASRGAGAQ